MTRSPLPTGLSAAALFLALCASPAWAAPAKPVSMTKPIVTSAVKPVAFGVALAPMTVPVPVRPATTAPLDADGDRFLYASCGCSNRL